VRHLLTYFRWSSSSVLLQTGAQLQIGFSILGFIGLPEAYVRFPSPLLTKTTAYHMTDTGYRRVTLNTQRTSCLLHAQSKKLTKSTVDDQFLETDIYDPAGTTYQNTPADLAAHIPWMASVNSRLPAGSSWFMEIGHNGNGNIEVSYNLSMSY